MFVRERVAPVSCRPPPGRYDGSSLYVYLHSETANCNMIFTLDETEPIDSGDREPGYRCEHYAPARGYLLRGGGKHTITVVASKPNCVSTRPQTFVFWLDGPKRRKKLHGQDHNVDHAFQLAARLTATAAPSSDSVVCLLKDVCSREDINSAVEQCGADRVRVYKLRCNSREVNRSITFERVATPSVAMTMPVIPMDTPSRLQRSESLRNSAVRSMTPTSYEKPHLLGQSHCASLQPRSLGSASLRPLSRGMSPSTLMLEGSRAQSPSAFHMTFTGNVSIQDDVRRSVLPRIQHDAHRERSVLMRQVDTDLSLFELRNGVAQLRADGVQEAVDKVEEDHYQAACEAVVQAEIQRKATISKTFQRLAMERPPAHAHREDVAECDHEPLTVFVAAMELVKTDLLRTVVATQPYCELHRQLNGLHHVTASELATILSTTVDHVVRTFKRFCIRSGDLPKYPCKILLAVVRYMVCLAEPIPEAPLYMFTLLWRIADAKNVEGPVGRVSFLAAVDIYRRTRGANAVALAQLQDAYYHGLEWSREGTVSLMLLLQFISDHIPHIDAAFGRMSDIEQSMYKRPLSIAHHSS